MVGDEVPQTLETELNYWGNERVKDEWERMQAEHKRLTAENKSLRQLLNDALTYVRDAEEVTITGEEERRDLEAALVSKLVAGAR